MNKEIKFRGISQRDRKWIYGNLYLEESGSYILNENNMETINEYGEELPCFIEVIPETIGQLFYKRNDLEVYIGDKVRIYGGQSHHGYYEYDVTFIVEFNSSCLGQLEWASNIKILNTIHDKDLEGTNE